MADRRPAGRQGVTWPAPTRADHDAFCRLEGWTPVRDALGRTGTHHITYELRLPDGQVLRTRVSHPPNRQTYGARLWAHILRDQLPQPVLDRRPLRRRRSVPCRRTNVVSARPGSRPRVPCDYAALDFSRVVAEMSCSNGTTESGHAATSGLRPGTRKAETTPGGRMSGQSQLHRPRRRR